MTYVEPEEDLPPVAGATIVYLGPVAPHWEIRRTFGETAIIDAFRHRVNARLLLLPKHDPQFRRNRERVNRDGERELIHVEWDLGDEEPKPAPAPAPEPAAVEAPIVEVADTPADPLEAAPEEAPTDAPADDGGEATVADDGTIASAGAPDDDDATPIEGTAADGDQD